MAERPKPTIAVFASDKGRGDPERASIMSHAGTFLARRGARLVCAAQSEGICVPFVKSARAAGGDVLVVAEKGFVLPSALTGINIETFDTKPDIQQHIGTLADGLIGLPGSLASATILFETWVGTGMSKPVALLNRNRAFEVVRGFAADILSHTGGDWERKLQFAESIEDLWNRLNRALNAR